MNVTIDLKEWRVKEVEGEKKIAGEFVVKAGAIEVSTQDFNGGGYSKDMKIIFSPELLIEANKLTERVAKEITQNFTGKEA